MTTTPITNASITLVHLPDGASVTPKNTAEVDHDELAKWVRKPSFAAQIVGGTLTCPDAEIVATARATVAEYRAKSKRGATKEELEDAPTSHVPTGTDTKPPTEEDFLALSAKDAIELIAVEGDVRALAAWRVVEKRVTVVAALDKRIGELRSAAGASTAEAT